MSVYQFVLLDPGNTGKAQRLKITIRRSLRALGIPARAAVFLPATTSQLDTKSPVVGVYFGHERLDPRVIGVVDRLLTIKAFVLPVVPSLRRFASLVPPSLHEINGMEEAPTDPGFERVAGRLLEELRLLRARRRVFISYRRALSRRVAVQLYHAFDEASYRVFLDTHGVASGVPFQAALWDQLSDTDLVVLLDAPGTLDSKWVAEEFAKANTWGISVLQVIWPNHQRARGTELCAPVYLDSGDFLRAPKAPHGGPRMRKASVSRLVAEAESLRARAFAARHARLVRRFCDELAPTGAQTHVESTSSIAVTMSRRKFRVVPVVGHPDSTLAYETFLSCKTNRRRGVLLYDPTGMVEDRAAHLRWLGEGLRTRVHFLSLDRVATWAREAIA